ncbi:MAG: serine hydrolase [Patescibacteria group bacterium]
MKTSAQKIFLFGVMILITLMFGKYSQGEMDSDTNIKEDKIKLSPAALEETVLEAVQALEEKQEERRVETSNALKTEEEAVLEVLTEEKSIQQEESLAPNFSAAIVSVSNLNSRDVFFQSEDAKRWPMASITKLMTAVVAFKKIEQSAVIEVTPKSFEFLEEEVSKIKVGEQYSRDDLIEIMLGTSSNEAAEVIANFYGREKFLEEMNLQANEWGLSNTHFKDPTGISVSNQSSASDLREMATRIYSENPTIFEITRRAKVDVRELVSKKVYSFTSNNTFTARKDFFGGKTGYTDEAQQNLLSIFKYDNQPILIIVLGTADRFEQTENLFNWYKNIYLR